jgi:hypothetical protein
VESAVGNNWFSVAFRAHNRRSLKLFSLLARWDCVDFLESNYSLPAFCIAEEKKEKLIELRRFLHTVTQFQLRFISTGARPHSLSL